jgi:hypothetical protein
MQELLPIASGLLLGGIFAMKTVAPALRAVLLVIAAACATVGSGEFRLSWSFLSLDLLEAALASGVGFFAVMAWRHYFAAEQ